MNHQFLNSLLVALALGALITADSCQAAPLVLFEDGFNDKSIDPTKWNVVTAGIPQNPKSAIEQNMQMELQGRAHLNTVQQFDPNDPAVGGITIRGQWEFVSGDDFMQSLTRSDGVPSGGFGETQAGIEFRAFAIGGDNVDIIGRGGAAINNKVGAGPFPNGIGAGDVFDFVIMDDGFNISIMLTRTTNVLDTITVTADSNFAPATNLISFHNRESGRRSNLDNVAIESKTLQAAPLPEPATIMIGILGIAGMAWLTWRRKVPKAQQA